MANHYLDTAFVDKAIKFAVDAHSGTERRGKGFPYVIHTLEAMEIVASITNDPELLAAAALHDTVEDTAVTVGQVRAEFGDRVASLVASETQEIPAGSDEVSSWRDRRTAGLNTLKSASRDAKIVAMGDKLSNMRAVARDYKALGEEFWSRFHAPNGKLDYAWYYRGLGDALSDLAGTDAYAEYCTLLRKTFGTPEPEPVDLKDYKVSGDGYTAVSYDSVDGDRMMKLYAEFMPLADAQREYFVSRALIEAGLKTPLATRLVTAEGKFGVEFKRIYPKQSFSRAIANNPERLEELATRFARMCQQLHHTVCDTSIFESAAAFFRKEVETSPYISDTIRTKALELIDNTPATDTCLHGDMHIGNAIIKTDTDEAYWIDLADFRYGNPLFDLGMFYFVSFCGPAEISEHIFHMPQGLLQQVWHTLTRVYYGQDADLAEIDRMVEPYAALYMIRFSNREHSIRPVFEMLLNKIFA